MSADLHLPESERAVLGSVLLDNSLLKSALVDLAVGDFHVPVHRAIFAEMLRLSEDGETFDPLLLAEALKPAGHFHNGDGAIYLDSLTDGVIPDAGRAKWHSKKVIEQAKLRCLNSLCETVQRESQGLTADPDMLFAKFRQFFEQSSRETDSRPEILNLAQVEAREVPWLWRPYLASGMLAMLSGDPGSGKTFIALAIAASLSIGRLPYSGDPCHPSNVLYLSEENSPEHVLRPRFDLLEGDSARFHILRGSIAGEGTKAKRGCARLSDIKLLSESIAQTNARLVVIDPVQSYLGSDVDAHRSNETRPVLDGLARIAEELKTCILLVRHFSKSATGRAIHRGLGSIDFTGAVRTELHAGSVDDSRALVQAKSNLGILGDSLGYVIEPDGSFRWTGKSTITAMDLQSAEATREERSDIDSACDYLETELASGPRRVKELEQGSELNPRTLRRAAQKLAVKRTREGERGPWIWELAK